MAEDDGPFAGKTFVDRNVEAEHLADMYFNKVRPYELLYKQDRITFEENNKMKVHIYYEVVNSCKDDKVLESFINDKWVKFILRGLLP